MCRTTDGSDGFDCYADGEGEKYECTEGYEVVMTGQVHDWMADYPGLHEFTCCPPSEEAVMESVCAVVIAVSFGSARLLVLVFVCDMIEAGYVIYAFIFCSRTHAHPLIDGLTEHESRLFPSKACPSACTGSSSSLASLPTTRRGNLTTLLILKFSALLPCSISKACPVSGA